MALPAAVFVAEGLLSEGRSSWNRWVFLVLWMGFNLTTFDSVGRDLGAFFEASSSLLIFHLALLFSVNWVAVEHSPSS